MNENAGEKWGSGSKGSYLRVNLRYISIKYYYYDYY